jgi:multicomponent Na+:H+ antiporter subunit D
VSLLTVLSMARVWEESFWKPAPEPAASGARHPRLGAAIVAPVAFLVTLTVGLTLAADPAYRVATRAAQQLLDSHGYVRAVLGKGVQGAAR